MIYETMLPGLTLAGVKTLVDQWDRCGAGCRANLGDGEIPSLLGRLSVPRGSAHLTPSCTCDRACC